MIAIVKDATAISEVGVRPRVDGRERYVEYALSISDGAGLRIEAADPHSGGDLPLPEHFPVRLKIAQHEPSGTKMTKWLTAIINNEDYCSAPLIWWETHRGHVIEFPDFKQDTLIVSFPQHTNTFPEGELIKLIALSGTLEVATTEVSEPLQGQDPNLVEPMALAIEPDGFLLIADVRLAAIMRVNPTTGDRDLLSGPTHGSGPTLIAPVALTMEADGAVVVVDTGLAAIMRIDPVSGDRNIVSR